MTFHLWNVSVPKGIFICKIVTAEKEQVDLTYSNSLTIEAIPIFLGIDITVPLSKYKSKPQLFPTRL